MAEVLIWSSGQRTSFEWVGVLHSWESIPLLRLIGPNRRLEMDARFARKRVNSPLQNPSKACVSSLAKHEAPKAPRNSIEMARFQWRQQSGWLLRVSEGEGQQLTWCNRSIWNPVGELEYQTDSWVPSCVLLIVVLRNSNGCFVPFYTGTTS